MEPTGRHPDVIEITPEMIEAGIVAYRFDPRFEDLADALVRSFAAMLAVALPDVQLHLSLGLE